MESVDLSEDYDNLPKEVIDILKQKKYVNGRDYSLCAQLVYELNQIGYTCEYDLDAMPYNLRKI